MARPGLDGLSLEALVPAALEANAAGSIVAGRLGAMLSMPTAEEVRALVQSR